ncbi:hypothetical protein GCM10007854_27420 [Algimonas porphyrae]|uniref:Uncharacterized protein n=2 Tax=Algimonas porphyrae TaxID=1128113 RepID=A0ABQ5V690_9PROT|nr:hypothetical protein GCM10007854_27420 [Algimonas porphyrae]
MSGANRMRFREGPAIGAMIIGVGLAFLMNRADFPLWQSLGAGIAVGLADYFFIVLIQERFRK